MSINFSRRKFLWYSGAVCSTSLLLKACSNNQTSTPTATGSEEALKVAIALTGVQVINNRGISAMEEFDIRGTGVDVKVNQLSGGNQQKVVLARELTEKPVLIVAMQPTRGLDIGATETLQQRLLAERERGVIFVYIYISKQK